MLITNINTLKQALANNRLESLTLHNSVTALLNKAMNEPNSGVTTEEVLEVLKNTGNCQFKSELIHFTVYQTENYNI